MQNLFDDLEKLLTAHEALIDERGKLIKNAVIDRAARLDPEFLKTLLSSDTIRAHFFADVEGTLIFDKVKFAEFVSNKAFLPDSYTAFRNRIGLTDGQGRYLKDSRDVVLAWPYKDCVLEGGMTKEDAKRDEIFWNTTLAPDDITRLFEPKALTGFERWDAEAVAAGKPKPVGEIGVGDHLLIKGNNLLALHSLKARYAGHVKLIYMDPPYNTGGDGFKYNDRFNHSTWLTFMRNRLEVAKDFLRPSHGVLAISIDHNEVFHLKVLCDEIFGRENFLTAVAVQNNSKGRVMDKNFSTSNEFCLFYSRGILENQLSVRKSDEEIEKYYPEKDNFGRFRYLELRNTHREFGRHNRPSLYYPLYSSPENGCISLEKDDFFSLEILPDWDDGFEGCWTWGQAKSELQSELLRAFEVKGRWKIYRKAYAVGEDGENVSKQLKTLWFSKDFLTDKGQAVVDDLIGRGVFRSPKPLGYIKTIVDLCTDPHGEDIVLDCFAGSGTTGHAVLALNDDDGGNRRFILAEQLAYAEDVTGLRLKEVLRRDGKKASFAFLQLAEWNEALGRRIREAADDAALERVTADMRANGYWRYSVDQALWDWDAFAKLDFDERKQMLLDALDANHLYVNYGDIADAAYGLSAEDIAVNRAFYEDEA